MSAVTLTGGARLRRLAANLDTLPLRRAVAAEAAEALGPGWRAGEAGLLGDEAARRAEFGTLATPPAPVLDRTLGALRPALARAAGEALAATLKAPRQEER